MVNSPQRNGAGKESPNRRVSSWFVIYPSQHSNFRIEAEDGRPFSSLQDAPTRGLQIKQTPLCAQNMFTGQGEQDKGQVTKRCGTTVAGSTQISGIKARFHNSWIPPSPSRYEVRIFLFVRRLWKKRQSDMKTKNFA